MFRLIRNVGRGKIPLGFTKDELFKTKGWGWGMKWTHYRQRFLSHGAIYDASGETPMYIFSPSIDKSYENELTYEIWLELIKRKDKRNKKSCPNSENSG